ncbi:BTAD domain-containing putative transcriptional regulator [Streptomyces sp. NPDC096030]|uniref:BTAD domain-containing putative transcriptional regulator n=1 Tax=Streptomyces sp. NPDC096030 TaxID=3155423 RepID=UPI00331EF616
MQFRVLGPMEVIDNGRTVGLGGTKQRATLGFLLLNANKAVATSRLLNALWGVDDAPMTARKILQNAVYGLRGALSGTRGSADADTATLLTQPPGYMMRVEPEKVDLHLFHAWVGQGRQMLSQGTPGTAAPLLRDALALWRGPALADLVESGVQWPELIALQNTRLDVMEDYFEAQLACGRHHEILAELETMVRAEPLRERSCGQLMLALYRCGRQADALAEYSRVRGVLVENLGLEPGRGLQRLQQSILAQDCSLVLEHTPDRLPERTPARETPSGAVLTAAPVATVALTAPAGAIGAPAGAIGAPADPIGAPADPIGAPARPIGASAVGAEPGPGAADAPEAAVPKAAEAAETGSADETDLSAAARRTSTDRRQVSVVSLRTRLAPSLGSGAEQELDDLLDGAALLVREQVERFGGTVVASIGSVSLALFGLDDPNEDDATRAVLAALAVRDVLDVSTGPDAGTAQSTVRAAITQGEVLLRRRGREEGPTVVGAVLDESQALLGSVPEGEVRVSDAVRRASEQTVVYRRCDSAAAAWQALGGRSVGASGAEQAVELDVLRGLAQRTRHRGVPHLVTILGEAGTGKSRLLGEFGRWAAEQPDGPLVVSARASEGRDGSPLAMAGRLLAAYCGVRPDDEEDTVHAALEREVRALYPSDGAADLPLHRLRPLVASAGVDVHFGELCPGEVLGSWREFFQEAAQRRPVTLCIDDLHGAPDMALDAVEELAESAGVGPLFVVACAGPELLARRPSWAGGKSHTTTVTLDPPQRISHEELVEFLLSASRNDTLQSIGEPRDSAAA